MTRTRAALSLALALVPAWLPAPNAHASGYIGFRCVECTAAEREKVRNAESYANRIVQASCFRDFMLDWGLEWTNGRSPEQVVSHLRQARLTVPVHYYYEVSDVVGYRNPPEPDVYFNRYFHDDFNVVQTASNAVHEWSHTLDYDHPYDWSSWREHTVPYAINHAFEDEEACGREWRERELWTTRDFERER